MLKELPKHFIDLENQISHVHPYQHMSTLFQACEKEKMFDQFFESNLIHMFLALDKFCNVCFFASIKLCLEKNIYPSNSIASSLHSTRILATIQVITKSKLMGSRLFVFAWGRRSII
jgi:hypothetical protein